MPKKMTLAYCVDDAVMVNGRAGSVDQITIRRSGVLYYIATEDASGRRYSDYFGEGQLTDPATGAGGPYLSSLEYFNLYTEDEQFVIFASTVPAVQRARAFAGAADYIDMSDAFTIGGIDLLVSESLLTTERSVEVKAVRLPIVTPAPAS